MKLEELKLKKALAEQEEDTSSITNAQIDTSANWERQPLFVRQTFYTQVFFKYVKNTKDKPHKYIRNGHFPHPLQNVNESFWTEIIECDIIYHSIL